MSNIAHVRRIVINLLVGPLAGSVTILILLYVHDMLTSREDFLLGDELGVWPRILLLLALGHAIGALPALIISLLTAYLFERVPRGSKRLMLTLAAGAFSAIVTIGCLLLGSNSAFGIFPLALLAAAGAVASLVASAVAEKFPARDLLP